MNICDQLAITIPTYNRADLLDCCLSVNIPIAREYGVPIYISDNGSTDHTHEVVLRRMKEYPLIRYYRNEVCIDVDDNFEKALKYPEADYVWLLGDTYKIPEGSIKYFLDQVSNNQNYDVAVFNLNGYIRHLSNQVFTDANEVFEQLCTLMTSLSCLVFSKKIIQEANFKRYKNSDFIQTGVIFEYIALNRFQLLWVQSFSVTGFKCHTKKEIWAKTDRVFEIGCHRWSAFVFSLPIIYPMASKYMVIRDFGTISGILTIRNLINLRKIKLLNLASFIRYRKDFEITVNMPVWFIFIIAVSPKFVLPLFRLAVSIVDRFVKVTKIFYRN